MTATPAKTTLQVHYGITPERMANISPGEAESVLAQAATVTAALSQPASPAQRTRIATEAIENLEAAIQATTSEIIYTDSPAT